MLWSDAAWSQLFGCDVERLVGEAEGTEAEAEKGMEEAEKGMGAKSAAKSAAKTTKQTETLRALEHRLLFLRVVVLFGWAGEAGRLVVLRVGSV